MGKEIDRLADHMQIYQYFIYNSGTGQHIMQDTGYDDPGKEMWKIRYRLHCLFPALTLDLIQ